ncbi:MAG: bacillithiol biosynthesis cysteine-adding enzyme BshC [Flavobacteriales bacterium]|jgi:bacillithiol synthase|nr:bacillithiol biosynthesis cysteine-adding enzyme BshC [Flavobacteriales bacterium]MBT3964870.1 bacillithiol biosynthesis cysteine-adding enzyme BshC [Flavobacteriales bacterium]MBT4704068.1 bacillithiol biosynthesis cysteine-adding enzyme BshC [Flavobacteriales bacterium]MBT4930715.1 bacillithiol biosynthesis cysteine-adding enzyme BshC [Flavobacteriales bacterium]MBT5132048.1 bacillithiol biosynthesis cysteine-adding enzyme BshC [Flavobacteriales bacterium]
MGQFNLHTSLSPNLSNLISKYLDGDSELRDLYKYTPDVDGLKMAAKGRADYPVDRELLVKVLKEQSQQSEYTTQESLAHIDRLSDPDVFTVTTGHQCCLFGGPMYFIYKIISVIRLAQIAEENGVKAVPIFWMATEDHDFEEINHCWVGSQKLSWESAQTGAVGRFDLKELEPVLGELQTLFKYQDEKIELVNKIKQIYSSQKTLAQATRDLCSFLFGKTGLVILNADAPALKMQFRDSIRAELVECISLGPVTKTSERLREMNLTTQVNPRSINLFWLDGGVRTRIERAGSDFKTADNTLSWSAGELLELVDTSPERFSPNVILRPVYQEQVLPNLAYVGGPGELSYALQLRSMFETHGTFFPMLVLRDMALIMSRSSVEKLEKLGITVEDFKMDYHQLEAEITRKHGSHESLVDDPEKRIEELLDKIQDDLKGFDETLGQSAETEKKRIIKRLEVLKKKVLKADKRHHQEELNTLRNIADEIFPGGVPQERMMNWLTFIDSVDQFTDHLSPHFNPFDQKMKVFISDK